MNVFGITGWKNSGKTTLTRHLIASLIERGYKVSSIKHAHHHFDIDKPGTDSYKHREAGASEVLITSGNRWALMHELKQEPEPELEDLLKHLQPVDVVIVEGFKRSSHPKIQVIRPDNNAERLPEDICNLVAIASDDNLNPTDYGCNGPLLDLNQVEQVADFVLDYLRLPHQRTSTATDTQ